MARRQVRPGSARHLRPPAAGRLRRFRCRQSGRKVSLLSDCLAALLPGTLAQVECGRARAGAVSHPAGGVAAGAPGVCEPGAAERWTRRRGLLVEACLELLRSLCTARFEHVEPTLVAFGAALGTQSVLVRLRAVAAAQLGALPARSASVQHGKMRSPRKKISRPTHDGFGIPGPNRPRWG